MVRQIPGSAPESRRARFLAGLSLLSLGRNADFQALAQSSLEALAKIVGSRRGDLWLAKDDGYYEWLASLGFGEHIRDRFLGPLLGGIQLDPHLEGSARMAQTVLHCLSVGDSAVPALGMQAIPDQLAALLPSGSVRLNAPVEPGVMLDVGIAAHDGKQLIAA